VGSDAGAGVLMEVKSRGDELDDAPNAGLCPREVDDEDWRNDVALESGGDSILPVGRPTCAEQAWVTRRDLLGVPSQQVDVLRSKVVNQNKGINSEIKSWCMDVGSGRDARNFASMRFRYRPVVCIAELDEHWDVPRMTRS
jgi:hypothetical protein